MSLMVVQRRSDGRQILLRAGRAGKLSLMEDPPVPPGLPPLPQDPAALAERVADVDRDRAVTQLREHVVEGRLTLDEFSERVGRALQASTRGDLQAAMSELPEVGTVTDRLPSPLRHLRRSSGTGMWRS